MAIDWSDEALNAMEQIGKRVANFAGDEAARRWRERVSERLELAEFLPFASRVVPEYGISTFREVFEDDYRILYSVVPKGIEVATISHGAMQLNG